MEIKNKAELNALIKLLFKVKFQEDLDFYEFRDFASSPILATLFEALMKETKEKFPSKLHEKLNASWVFEFDNQFGKVIRKRILELSEKEIETLLNHNQTETYLQTLIRPLDVNPAELNKLIQFTQDHFSKQRDQKL